MTKVYSIQPRFKPSGDPGAGGWAWVDNLFHWGVEQDLPMYPSPARDMYLAHCWKYEPVLAGAINTATDKMATSEFTLKGGRNNVNFGAAMCHRADGGRGWAVMLSELYQDYTSTNRGGLIELGRANPRSRTGRVLGMQHLDATRVMYTGQPDKSFRYLPVAGGDGIDLWNDNVIQIVSLPSPRDRFRGSGLCSIERLRDSIELMIGWLTHDRQMVGNLPPEALLIINGLGKGKMDQSYLAYKQRREQVLATSGSPIYAGFWMIGSDMPSNKVEANIVNLRRTDQYDRNSFYEWWVKLIAINLGHAVGEFWLIQHSGATKASESIQTSMGSSKGVGRFAQDLEWQLNTHVFQPMGVTFRFDTQDDLQDEAQAGILAQRVDSLLKMAQIADPMGTPLMETDEIKQLAVEWNILAPEAVGERVPSVISSRIKELAADDGVVYRSGGTTHQVKPLVGPALREQFKELAQIIEMAYVAGGNGNGHGGNGKLPELEAELERPI